MFDKKKCGICGTKNTKDAITCASCGAPLPIRSKEDVEKVASAAAQDSEIGVLVAGVMEKVGVDGYIAVEVVGGSEYEIEYIEGMRLSNGYISSDFVTNATDMEAVMDDPFILVADVEVSAADDISSILEKTAGRSKSLVVIANDVKGDAMHTLVERNRGGKLKCLAVKAAGSGDQRKAVLDDVAILTGGSVISKEGGRKLNTATVDDLGRARRVVATGKETTIVEGRGSEESIIARIKQIKARLEEITSESEREELSMRLANLVGGVAILKVRTPSEKRRVEDALSAVRAAIKRTM